MFIFTKTCQLFLSSNKKISYLSFFLYFATKYYLQKTALALSLCVTHTTNTFRKLFFNVALIVKLSCFTYQATRFHFFPHSSGANNFFKIAQNIILHNGCAAETEPFPFVLKLLRSIWKFLGFGNFWAWQNYRVKKKTNRKQGAKPAIFTPKGNLGGTPSALPGGRHSGGVVLGHHSWPAFED